MRMTSFPRRIAQSANARGGDTIWRRLRSMNWLLVALIIVAACIGFTVLYSAADGNWQPWAMRQVMRFCLGFVLMLAIALVDLRIWWRLAYPIYGIALALLVLVEAIGVGEGSHRWIALGFMNLQPSEIMKVALVLSLARYFNDLDENQIDRLVVMIPPLLLTAVPAALVLRQPDLGTASILVALAVVVTFLAGLAWWKFALGAAAVAAAAPLTWSMLHDYQRDRVLTFIDPGRDPLGSGYHILQSKIALGSGGLFGKGFIGGTQSQLNFLPEKHTDFIFTMMAEEFGFAGSIFMLSILVGIMVFSFLMAMRATSIFSRLIILGLSLNFFLYAFINMAMVMGLMPVVGVPLPMISYGGTAMLTLMIGFGLIQSAAIHRGGVANQNVKFG
jgi:rod shape determining protein RodA